MIMTCRRILLLLSTSSLFTWSLQLSTSLPYDSSAKPKVIVTGAAGRTGKRVFSKLLSDNRYEGVGLVRSEKSAKSLLKELNCGIDHIVVCDVTTLADEKNIPKGLAGAKAMVICTSAVPQLNKLSLLKTFLKAPFNLIRGKKAINPRSFRFDFKAGQYPEIVDYEGQKAQIDMALKLGISHVVVVSSMGGTDKTNFLNSIGKFEDGSGNGDILIWKRRAEKYLTESGLRYTIIHPGGLTDKEESVNELVLDVDDVLLANKQRSISRGDVASLCVAALSVAKDQDVSFDAISREVEEGQSVKSAEEYLKEFLALKKTADYSLGEY